MEKQHKRDFLEIEEAIKSRIAFLDSLSYPKEETEIRKQELDIIRKRISKIRYHRLNPLESITTVHGTNFKLGDYFHIPGDTLSKYKIVLFPDAVTIRGVSENPAIGKPWICEIYIEDAQKVKIQKEVKTQRIVKEKVKRKKIRIESGEYFATRTNNTIYKALIVTNKMVTGFNKLKSNNVPKQIKVSLRDIIVKTKKEYKQQHKIENKHE